MLGKSQIWVETFSAEKHAKVDIKLFLPRPVLPDLPTLLQIPCPGL